MRGRFGKRLAESGRAFRAVFANPDLRRLELAWSASIIGHWAYGVALSVYAFEKGGASAVGLTWVIRMIPSALASPFTSMLADRYRREWVMLSADFVRSGLIAGAAAGIWLHVAPGVVYALAALVSVAGTPFRPAQAALVPSLAKTPAELTAANVAASSIESLGFFGGPALAGVLLTVTGSATIFVVTAGTFLLSALFITRIRAPREARADAERAGIVSEALAGFRAIGADARLRLLIGLLTAVTLVVGALEVLVVVSAIDLLDIGKSGVGFLNSAFGVGALVGALGALALVGVRRLSLPFIAGVLLWGAPVALIGAWPRTAAALVFLGLVGAGNTLVDVAGFTLVQRAVPDEVLARVFGVIQMLWLGMIGIGAIVVPPLIDWLGIRGALVATGAFLPALVLLFGLRLVRIDAAATAPGEVGLLRAIPLFAPLPGTALEHLAARLVPLRFDPGTEIIRQGDPGDRFYLIAEGEVEVRVDGQSAPTLGPGEYFGEIALLRDVPRTATVVARTPVTAYALEREDFLGAVASNAPSARAADAVIGTRLGRARAGDGASAPVAKSPA